MKSPFVFMLAALFLTSYTSHKPGAFERVDEDHAVNAVQYRSNPLQLDRAAMQNDVTHNRIAHTFDESETARP
ncbi:hypothetical protein SAMN05216516_102531 [Izhakiella capsodis]|uniref:Uncharacterized protein n=1 Tax=Izhakiella capsodis TaxID=1367852 RepID=A0A1I4WJ44_9GAMM|nr:hypothetical protein [Izhakiella capsodis]SFN13435.1 hypothetical protein SAMN05216516_102531 [Izhakiella capsodis]